MAVRLSEFMLREGIGHGRLEDYYRKAAALHPHLCTGRHVMNGCHECREITLEIVSACLQGQIQKAVSSLLTANTGVKSITVTGHSLGGALASMCAFDLAVSEINKVGYSDLSGRLILHSILVCSQCEKWQHKFLIRQVHDNVCMPVHHRSKSRLSLCCLVSLTAM